MTLYHTNKTTGEMTPLLAPLHHKPRGKVKRLPSPRIAHQSTYRPRRYKQPVPLSDLLLSLSACVVAIAFLLATLEWPA